MARKDKIEIPREDIETMTIDELMAKYRCSDITVMKRRKELGAKNLPRKTRLNVAIPPEMIAKWVELYRDQGLTVKTIHQRYPMYALGRIQKAVRDELGPLEGHRRNGPGWCAT